MSVKKQIAFNSLASIISRVIYTLVSLVIIGVMTRYLGEEGFGEYSTVLAVVYVFTVLADLGLYSITLRDISRSGANEIKIVSNSFTLRTVAGLFLFTACSLVVWLLPYSLEVKQGVMIGSLAYWLLSNVNVLLGVFQKNLKMALVGLAELAGRLMQLGLMFLAVKLNLGFTAIIWTMVVGTLAHTSLIVALSRRFVPFRLEFDFVYWRQLLKESLPLAASSVLVMFYFKFDTLMLSLMKSQEDVGIYSVAYKVLENLIFLPTMFVGLVMPLISKFFFKDLAYFKRIANSTQRVFIIIATPLFFGGALLAQKIITLLAGKNFLPASGVLVVLLASLVFIFFGALYSNILIAIGKQKFLTLIYGLGAVFNFGLNLFFIPRFSYTGAAITTLLTELAVTVAMAWILYRKIKFVPSFRPAWSALAASLLMAGVIYWLRPWGLLELAVLGGIIYFACLYALGGVKKDDLKLFLRKDEKVISILT